MRNFMTRKSGIHFAMVRCYQERHVPEEILILKSYLFTKNLEGSQQVTSLQIYMVRYDNCLLQNLIEESLCCLFREALIK